MTRKVIRATLDLLTSDRGGREGPILPGYRSLARFEGVDRDFGFELDLDSKDLAPGDTGTGRLSFWAGDELPELHNGQRFELREGARVVGHGTVVEPDDA
jgi:translation elongation factor EF-Tu-like GTPase